MSLFKLKTPLSLRGGIYLEWDSVSAVNSFGSEGGGVSGMISILLSECYDLNFVLMWTSSQGQGTCICIAQSRSHAGFRVYGLGMAATLSKARAGCTCIAQTHTIRQPHKVTRSIASKL